MRHGFGAAIKGLNVVQSYGVWWSDEDRAWLATETGLPAGTIHGETPEEALRNAIEVANEWRDAGFTAAGAHEPWTPVAVRALRRSLDLSQQEFAALLNVALATVRGWEQGARQPAGPSIRLLDMVAAAPGIARKWSPALTERVA